VGEGGGGGEGGRGGASAGAAKARRSAAQKKKEGHDGRGGAVPASHPSRRHPGLSSFTKLKGRPLSSFTEPSRPLNVDETESNVWPGGGSAPPPGDSGPTCRLGQGADEWVKLGFLHQ
jgi:hypothetical protein